MSPSSRAALTVACTGHLLCHGAKVILPVSLAVGAAEFGVGLVPMAWALTAFGLAMGVMAVPAGLLADRLGPVRVLALYFWTLAGAALLCRLVEGYAGFVAAHALLGAAAGLYHPPGLALISLSASRDEIGPAMGIHGVLGNIGIAFAPLLVLAMTPLWGWRGVFLVLAASAVAGGLLLALVGSRGALLLGRPVQQPASEGVGMGRGALLALLVVVSVNGFLLDGFLPLFPETVRRLESVVWDPMVINAAILSVGCVGQFAGGLMARGAGQQGRFLLLLALQPLTFVGTAAALGVPTVAVLQLSGFTLINFMTQPMENRFLAAFTSTGRRSRAYALKFLVALVIGAAAGPIVASLLEAGQVALAYLLLAAIAVVGVLAWLRFVRAARSSTSVTRSSIAANE